MANNNVLFNAAYSGALTGLASRWVEDESVAASEKAVIAAVAFATEVDALIPAGAFTAEQGELLYSLCSSVWEGRIALSDVPSKYLKIATSIVGLFNNGIPNLLAVNPTFTNPTFTNPAADGGNPTLKVAPEATAQILALDTAANENYPFDPINDGVYRYAISVTVKRATGGEYRTDDYAITCVMDGGLTLLGAPKQLDIGGDSTGLTTTISVVDNKLNVNVANGTGQTVNGYIWVGPIRGDLIQ